MATHTGFWIRRRRFLFAGAALCWSAQARAYAQPLVVIVGKDSRTTDLRLATLQQIFGGEHVKNRAGQRMLPFNQPLETPERTAIDRIVLGLRPDDVARYWIDRKIRGQSGPPRTVPSATLVRRVVAQLAGAVGYLQPNQVDASVRVVSIDGKHFSDPGYPLVFSK